MINSLYFLINGIYLFPYYSKIPMKNREKLTFKDNIMGYYNDNLINSSDFVWIFNPFYGNCFQLNTYSNWKVQKYNDNSLQLQFKYHDYESIIAITGKDFNNLEENFYSIFIGDKKSNPFIEQKNVFKFENDIQEAELKITKSVFNKQKKPYSNCDFIEDDDGNFEYPSSFDRKYYEQIKSAGYEYSQSMCISFCQVDRIGRNCSLGFSSINAPTNLDNLCSVNDFYSPIELYFYLFDLYNFYFKNENFEKECVKMCPLECKSEQYELSLIRNKGYRNLKSEGGYIRVDLNFDSVSYVNYEESPSISVYNLVSNIGGAIGLLLGMSLLSIFEVLEMIVLAIVLIIQHKFKSFKLKKQKSNQSIL